MANFFRLVTFTLLLSCICYDVDAKEFNLEIPGPKSYDDKIAVVGAGPAGIHMAYLLKEKGFTNVKVLEKSERIGGKSLTTHYRGVSHEMGTCYISPDYEESIIHLVKKYIPDDLVPFPPASVWLDKDGPIKFKYYFLMKAWQMGTSINDTIMAIMKYTSLHNEIFGDYEFELMPKPDNENLLKIRGTFLEFLERNKIGILYPIFLASTTIQGYGQLNEISALYGLMWNHPKLIYGLLEAVRRKGRRTYMLKTGFQNLWETIAKENNLKITFNAEITEVSRKSSGGQQYVSICTKNDGCEDYDFLMWSPEMKTSLPLFDFKEEEELFKRSSVTYFTTSLFNSENEIRGKSPIDYFIYNVHSGKDNCVWAQRDSYGVLHRQFGDSYKECRLPTGDDGNDMKTSVAYQMASNLEDLGKINDKLVKHFTSIGGTNISIRKSITWRYFPRYSPEDMDKGILWDILEMQGKHSTWYIGSSVIFESVKSVVEYNKLLLKYMKKPDEVRK